jgi:hypothetical protein
MVGESDDLRVSINLGVLEYWSAGVMASVFAAFHILPLHSIAPVFTNPDLSNQ